MNPYTNNNKTLLLVLEEQQQQTAARLAELAALGIDDAHRRGAGRRHSAARILDVAAAARRRASRNPAGWAIRALEDGWTVAVVPAPAAALDTPPAFGVEASDEGLDERWRAWDHALSAALTDKELAKAVAVSCDSMPSDASCPPCAQLVRWAHSRGLDGHPRRGGVPARCGGGDPADGTR